MKREIGIGILGGTGYGAGELLRLLSVHPQAEVVSITSTSKIGASVCENHTHLSGLYSLKFSEKIDFDKLSKYANKVIFAALPHGTSAGEIKAFLSLPEAKGVKVIDLSGDFRLKDSAQHAKYYPEAEFSSELRKSFVYGLTELNRAAVKNAAHISNPGCLSSACILAAAPLIAADYKGSIVFDAKTGTSGAGKSPSDAMHHPTRHSNIAAYKILEHRHEPEILQGLGDERGERIESSFVPHLLPAARGIFASAYLSLPKKLAGEDLTELYKKFYEDSPFIRVRNGSPQLHDVVGSNFCDVSVTVRGNQVVCMAALDNLVKGMAGQALQNMNLMCGLDEKTGLWFGGLGPS